MNSSLSSLLNHESESPALPKRSRRLRDLSSFIPIGLLIGFAVLLFLLFGEALTPTREVELVSVVTTRALAAPSAGEAGLAAADPWGGETVFQASGWIEPDPLPIKATSLVDGVVDSVTVLEGESVQKGQVLATLIREDFELDLATAKSDLASLRALEKAHMATIRMTEAKLVTLDKQVEAQNRKYLELTDRRDRLKRLGTRAISEEELTSAELQLMTQKSEIEALEATENELKSERDRMSAMHEDFTSKVMRAQTEIERRALALSRTEIRSPVDGIVLRLLAGPGQKKMLGMDDADSATIAILYEPDSLQARIDVPLEEASRMAVGQAVLLRSNFLPDQVFKGEVTRIVGEADLQRNTLQAKVRVIDPDSRMRPEMLVRAEFLKTTGSEPEVGAGGAGQVSIFVSANALVNENEVWSLDESGKRIEKRILRLGGESREGFVAVAEGLRPGDRVVLDPAADLEAGDVVKGGVR